MIGNLHEAVEEGLALVSAGGVCLYKLNDSIDELFLADLRCCLGATNIVLVDPHSPLVALVHQDHALCGLKNTEDVYQ